MNEEIERLKDLLIEAVSKKDDALHAFEVKAEYCDRVEAQRDALLGWMRTWVGESGHFRQCSRWIHPLSDKCDSTCKSFRASISKCEVAS